MRWGKTRDETGRATDGEGRLFFIPEISKDPGCSEAHQTISGREDKSRKGRKKNKRETSVWVWGGGAALLYVYSLCLRGIANLCTPHCPIAIAIFFLTFFRPFVLYTRDTIRSTGGCIHLDGNFPVGVGGRFRTRPVAKIKVQRAYQRRPGCGSGDGTPRKESDRRLRGTRPPSSGKEFEQARKKAERERDRRG